MRYSCCEPLRLEALELGGSANAIAFLEVRDHAEPSLPLRQRTLFVRLLRPGFTLTPDHVLIDGGQRIPVVAVEWVASADNLPAGTLRVLARDRDGRSELLGESRIGDTAKGRKVDVTLGVAFDLGATRERSSFDVDKSAREMREGFRIKLTNSGESARTITVREHPNRWRVWTLASSSHEPERKSPDLLEFRVAVPAGGEATLDYVVRYNWTPSDE